MSKEKRIVFFSNKKNLFKKLNQEILKISQKYTKNILIAGGSSIKKFYPYLNDYKHNLILSDERIVGKSSQNSNYNNLCKYIKNKEKILWPNKIFYKSNLDKKKIIYSKKFLTKKKLSFSILTIGEDGHIASIFNKNLKKSLNEKCISVVKKKKEKFKRISISLKKINTIKKNFVVVIGKKKKKLLNQKRLPFNIVKNSIIFATNK